MIYEKGVVYSRGVIQSKNGWKGNHFTAHNYYLVADTTEGRYMFEKHILGWRCIEIPRKLT